MKGYHSMQEPDSLEIWSMDTWSSLEDMTEKVHKCDLEVLTENDVKSIIFQLKFIFWENMNE